MNELLKKMWEVKRELPVMKKASKGFKFKYTNLSDIEKKLIPVLEEKKIGYVHRLDISEGSNVLNTSIFCLDTGETQSHRLVIPPAVKLAGMNDYQSLGSALTYFRRYHLVVAFGILTDEDVDAIQPKVKAVSVNHVEKVQQLIAIGRAKSTLEKYFTTYSSKMSDAERVEIKKIIKNLK